MSLKINSTPSYFDSQRLGAPPVSVEAPQDSYNENSSPPPVVTFKDVQKVCRPTFQGIGPGSGGPRVAQMQKLLNRWNPRLHLNTNGSFDERTAHAVALFRGIYTPTAGAQVDVNTASVMQSMQDGSFWKNPPAKTPGQALLYQAAQKLGLPYVRGGDGVTGTDCARLTSGAIRDAGLARVSVLADMQYKASLENQGLTATRQPKPGDLVFMDLPTSQSSEAYRGVTHVGIYVSPGLMLAASSRHGVVLQPTDWAQGHIVGYASAQR